MRVLRLERGAAGRRQRDDGSLLVRGPAHHGAVGRRSGWGGCVGHHVLAAVTPTGCLV